MSTLYTRNTYLTSAMYENSIIREYDMRDAGFNIIKEFKLLSEIKIQELETMEKMQRKRAIGILQIDDKKFANELIKGFMECRKMFFEKNNLDDSDIVSIKKDAIFVKDRVCKYTTFGDYIEFAVKNKYTHFLNLNGIEFYYDERFDTLDVKGVSDDLLPLHEDGMLQVIRNLMRIVNSSSQEVICKKLQKLVSEYKNFELHEDTYRELNSVSKFRCKIRTAFFKNTYVDSFGILGEEGIDISYNFMRYIQPIINVFY